MATPGARRVSIKLLGQEVAAKCSVSCSGSVPLACSSGHINYEHIIHSEMLHNHQSSALSDYQPCGIRAAFQLRLQSDLPLCGAWPSLALAALPRGGNKLQFQWCSMGHNCGVLEHHLISSSAVPRSLQPADLTCHKPCGPPATSQPFCQVRSSYWPGCVWGRTGVHRLLCQGRAARCVLSANV